MKKIITIILSVLCLAASAKADTYRLVTNVAELHPGDRIVLAYGSWAMTTETASSTYKATAVNIVDNALEVDEANPDKLMIIELIARPKISAYQAVSEDYKWILKYADNTFLTSNSSTTNNTNSLTKSNNLIATKMLTSISVSSNGTALIKFNNGSSTYNTINCKNISSTTSNYRFSTYEGTTGVKIYRRVTDNSFATLDFKDMGLENGESADGGSFASEGVALSFATGSASAEPSYNATSEGITFSKSNMMTVAVGPNCRIRRVEIHTADISGDAELSAGSLYIYNNTWAFNEYQNVPQASIVFGTDVTVTGVEVTYSPEDRATVYFEENMVEGGDTDRGAEDPFYVNEIVCDPETGLDRLSYALTSLPDDFPTDKIEWVAGATYDNFSLAGNGNSVDINASCGRYTFAARFEGNEKYRSFQWDFELAVYPNHYEHFAFVGDCMRRGNGLEVVGNKIVFRIPNPVEDCNYYYQFVSSEAKGPRKLVDQSTDGFTLYDHSTGVEVGSSNAPATGRINMLVESNGVASPVYTVAYDTTDPSVSSISSIDTDACDAVFYDLNGRRTGTPRSNGVYIRAVGGTVGKVIIP